MLVMPLSLAACGAPAESDPSVSAPAPLRISHLSVVKQTSPLCLFPAILANFMTKTATLWLRAQMPALSLLPQ